MKSDALVESLECAIILIDRESMVERVNIAAETLFCQSRRYLVGRQLEELIPNKDVLECFMQCMQNHAQYTCLLYTSDAADD